MDVGLLGLLLLVGGVALFVALNLGDAPERRAADLRVERPVVRPEDNAYRLLRQARTPLVWDKTRAKRLIDLARDASWDDRLARETVRENRRALRLLGEALVRPAFQTPPFRVIDDDLPNMLPWLELARISAIRALLRSRTSAVDSAFSDAVAPLRLGQLVQSGRGGVLIHAMVGVRLKQIGIDALSASLRHVEPSPAQSLRWTATLAGLRTDPGAWRAMWASEYQVMKPIFATATNQGDAQRSLWEGVPEAVAMSWLTRILPADYGFKSQATLDLYAHVIRQHRHYADQPCAHIPQPSGPHDHPIAMLAELLLPNGDGRILVDLTARDLLRFEGRRCRSDSRIASTAVLLALRAFQVAHGALPTSVDALVPRYIARIPESAMDDKPLRYSRSTRKICEDDACAENSLAIPF